MTGRAEDGGKSPSRAGEPGAGAWDTLGRLKGTAAADRWVSEAMARKAAPKGAAAKRTIALTLLVGLILAGGAAALRQYAQSRGTLLADAGPMPRHVALPDGSSVLLDKGARVRVRFAPRSRRIDLLDGHAYFTVAKDRTRPFTVDVPGVSVTAVGTAFDVRRDGQRAEVVLVEGRLRVQSKFSLDPPGAMGGGSRLVSGPEGWRISAADTSEQAAWAEGLQIFRRTGLARVAASLNANARIPVEVAPQLAERPISGVFRVGDTSGLTASIPAIYPDIAVESTERGYRLVMAAKKIGSSR
jgi:transmembrane sensor